MRRFVLFAALGACLAQEDRAKEFIDLLVKGDFTWAETMFDDTMKGAVPPDKLGAIWQSLAAQLGSFKKVIATHQETKGEYLNVYETCEFGATNFDLIVTFDKQGQIAGFHAAPASYVPTTEQPPAGVIELAVKVEGLDGALTLPQSGRSFPGLVLVHGSGPQDRDETIGRNKPFRDLAWGLASRGIAVLRYDKRKNFPTDATVRQETIDDAVAAAALLRKTEGIDPRNVFALGHSLGGYLIPRIAAAAPDVRGFISLAGATRPLEDMLVEQAQTLGGNPAEAKAIAAKIRTIKPGDPPVFGASAAYWLDLRGYDPAAAARAIDRPMLILQGEADRNVTMTDFQNWKRVLSFHKNVTFRSYPGLNHLFMNGTGLPSKDYAQPGHVSEAVLDDIARWIRANSAQRR